MNTRNGIPGWLAGVTVAGLTVLLALPRPVTAGGFFETGAVTLNTTVDDSPAGWVTVGLGQSYVNPVVVAGPLSHNNGHSLYLRVRNVTATSFQIGMQSACEETGVYQGPRPSDPPEQAVCPPAAGWVSETANYWVMEQGTWEFPDGQEVEADLHSTTTVRSQGPGTNNRDQVGLSHTYASSNVIIYHTVDTFNDSRFIHSTSTNDTTNSNPPAPSAADNDFGLALEGMEVHSTHGLEDIGWIAIEPASGTNAGFAYNSGRTARVVDRHEDGCYNVGSYAVGANPVVVSQHNTMQGNNGGGVRLCGAGITAASLNVHMDEDQVNDAERTGIPEVVTWFVHQNGGFGALDFITATKTVTDQDGDGFAEPGELLTYDLTLTNQLDDFAQLDTAGDNELIDSLDANVTFDSVISASTGTLAHDAGQGRMEWDGQIDPLATVTMSYRVRVDAGVCAATTISNQAVLQMDPNRDGSNSVLELSDDPAVDIGGDTDGDTLTGDDDPTLIPVQCPTIAIDDVSQVEGSGGGTTPFVFSVTLSETSFLDVDVDYATNDGTATTADADYTALPTTTLTIPAGLGGGTVTVDVTADDTVEPDETFTVDLTNPVGASIADAQGEGTIQNDDAATFSIGDVTQAEGNAGSSLFQFPVTLSTPVSSPVTVDYATTDGSATVADGDYVAASGSLVFVPGGPLSQTVDVTVNGDTVAEADETFAVDIFLPASPPNVSVSDGTAVGTITNDDTVTLSIDDVAVAETDAGTTTATFAVTLSSLSASDVSVDFTTTDGTATVVDSDYVANAGTLLIPAGNSDGTISVTINGDVTVEPDETYTVDLSNPVGATISDAQGLGTITNDDAATFSIGDVTQAEGNAGVSLFQFSVTLSAPVSSPVTVDYASTDGTATVADSDYVAASGSLVFVPGGPFSQSVDVTVNGDTVAESDETFTVDITLPAPPANVSIADGTALGTITNDDAVMLSVDDVAVLETDAGTTTATFTVALSGLSASDISVDFATADGTATVADSDYVASSGTLLIPAGNPSGTINVTVNGDVTVEPDETYVVDLSNPVGATISDAQGQGTITNDDPATFSIGDVTQAEGDAGTSLFQFPVTLSAPVSSPVTVDYATTDGTATVADSDYVGASASLVFVPGGPLSQTVDITVNGDTVAEPDETFTVDITLPASPPNVSVMNGTAVGTITNDDAVTLSIDDVAVLETDAGTTTAVFTVSLSTLSASDVSVDFATTDGTATVADSDYVVTTGTLLVPAGNPSGTISVTVNGDVTVEPDETYTVDLSNPVGATIADAQGQGTITNDDTATFSIGDVTQAEGNAGTSLFQFPVTLSAPVSSPVTADYATTDGTATTADSDYLGASASLVFVPGGPLSQTVDVTVNGDTIAEPDETFTVDISLPAPPPNVSVLDGTAVGTITNDDTVTLSIDDVAVLETDAGTTTATFTVSLSNLSASDVSVDFTTTDGTATVADSDYVTNAGTLLVPAGNPSGTITITINGDTVAEVDETYTVDLSNPVGATISDPQGQGTITNDDAVTLSIDDVALAETNAGTTTAVFTVTLSNLSASDVSVDFTTTDGTATVADSDYVANAGTLLIPAGNSDGTISVTVNGDVTVEPDETYTVDLSNPVGATIADAPGQGTITNDDTATFSIGDVTQVEGDVGTSLFQFPATMSAPVSSPVTVDYTTTDGTATVADGDYVAAAGSLVFVPGGPLSQTVDVTVNGDTVAESDETFTVDILLPAPPAGVSIADGTAVGTITNDDAVTLSIDDVVVAETDAGTTTAIFTVALSNLSASDVSVDFTTTDGTATVADSDYVANAGTLLVLAGNPSGTISVTVNGDVTVELDETYMVDLSNPVGATIADAQGQGTITNDDSATFSVGDVTQAEGNAGTSLLQFPMTLSAPVSSPVTVDYASTDGTATVADSDYVAAAGSLVFVPGGLLSQTVDVTVNGDTVAELDETFTVDISLPAPPPNVSVLDGTAVGTITNDDTVTLSIDDVAVLETDAGTTTATFTVSLSNLSASDVSVDFTTTDSTAAVADSDYVTNAGTLLVPAGNPSGTISVTVNGDATVEPDETYTVDLSNPVGATISDAQGLGTITNDDSATFSIGDVTQAEGNAGTSFFQFPVTLSAPVSSPVTVDYATTDGTATVADSDYAAAAGSLVFVPGGPLSQTVDVTVNGDTVAELDETFTVDITLPAGPVGVSIVDGTALGTITNDDAVTLSVNDVAILEIDTGTASAVFTVSLSNLSASDVSVDFATADGTATVADNDYLANTGTLLIPAANPSGTISVTVNGDAVFEPDETFDVNLSNAVGATIVDAQALGTITNDDVMPALSIADVTQAEGDAGTTSYQFAVTLSGLSASDVSVDFATAERTATVADTDYVAASGTLVILAGETTGTILVDVNGDTNLEPDEMFVVDLSNPVGATLSDAQAQGTLLNDDTGTLQGQVWLDSNANDVLDAGEQTLVGWNVEVLQGSASVVAAATDNQGAYAFSGLSAGNNYEVRLRHVETNVLWSTVSNLTLVAGVTVLNQDLPVDPSGTVYDSVARVPVPGVTVSFLDGNGNPVPAICLASGQQAQVTGSDGAYRFDLNADADPACPSDAEYRIGIVAPVDFGAVPSVLLSPFAGSLDPTGMGDPVQVVAQAAVPQLADPTDYYLSFVLAAGDPDVINNHIPLDPAGITQLTLNVTKEAGRSHAGIGELLPYAVTLENTSDTALAGVTLVDNLPAGFYLVEDSVRLDGATTGFTLTNERPLELRNIQIGAGATTTLSYVLLVSPAVTEGDHTNTIQPLLAATPIGNQASARVTVTADSGFEKTTIIGKVFQDTNANGWQDLGERGIPGVRLATTSGMVVETDEFGRYHIAAVDGGFAERGRNFIVKLDDATLPRGSQLTTENPRVQRITQGLMNRFDFGVRLIEEDRPMQRVEGELGALFFESGSAAVRESHAPLLAQLAERLSTAESANLTIQVGAGADRDLAERRARYVADTLSASLGDDTMQNIRIEIQDSGAPVTPLGRVLFEFGQDEIRSDEESTIGQLAERINEQGGGVILIDGHTDSVGSETFNEELGLRRAQTVRDSLDPLLVPTVETCTVESCVTDGGLVIQLASYGETQPVADNSTPEGREQNRRAEVQARFPDAIGSTGAQSVDVSGDFVVPLDGAGEVWATEDAAVTDPRLAVNGPDYWRIVDGGLESALTFHTYTNYGRYLDRMELAVYRADDIDRVSPLGVVSVDDVEAPVAQFLWSPNEGATRGIGRGDQIVYQLRAYDASGLFDETFEQSLSIVDQADLDDEFRRIADDLVDSAAESRSRMTSIYGQNHLERRNIPVHGSRLRIHGRDIGQGYQLTIDGATVPVDEDRKFAAEYMLPIGVHEIQVVLTGPDGDVIERTLQAEVSGRYIFMTALADLTISGQDISGAVEPLAADDRYAEETLVEGRLAFYLKGKIQGRYLVTAQLDTTEEQLSNILSNLDETDNRSLFRHLDPDRYYPVYGDDSTGYLDTDTQGRMYVRVDWDKSSAVWGNFLTQMTTNELAQYSRGLYGGQFHHLSLATTELGDSKQELNVFVSEAQSALGHSEFLGTGGSLYYLKHTDILQGSEQLRIEIRDEDSGRVIENIPLVRSADYELDELQGRVLLRRPLQQVALQSGPSLIRDGLVDGDDVVLIADYEYVPSGFSTDQATAGVRGRQWIGEHVAVGGTYVGENRAGDDYALAGLDLTLQAGKGTYVKLEGASTESTQAPRHFSDNGGLSFGTLNPVSGAQRAGDAYSVEARANLREQGLTENDVTTGAWFKRVDDQFSVARRDDGVNTEEFGAEVIAQVNGQLKLSGRASVIDQETRMREERVGVQADYRLNERGTVTAELLRLEERDAMLQEGTATLAAVQYTHRLSDSIQLHATGQGALEQEGTVFADPEMFAVGGQFSLGERTSLGAESTIGEDGTGLVLNLDHEINGNHSIYGSYTHSSDSTETLRSLYDRRTSRQALTLGHRSRISNQTRVFGEAQVNNSRDHSGLTHVFGLDFAPAPAWSLGLSMQSGELDGLDGIVDRDAVGLSASYRNEITSWTGKIEFREDQGSEQRTQWLVSQYFDLEFTDSLTLLAKLNLADTEDRDLVNDARFTEASLGFAYRPTTNDRLNILGKYTYLYDLGSAAHLNIGTDQRSHVLSTEAIYRLTPKWELGGKVARRTGDLRVERGVGEWYESTTNLMVVRGRYQLLKRWEAMAEYRVLEVEEAEGVRDGFLIGVDRHFGDHFKLGIGYNFSDFSDDLTRLDYSYDGWFLNAVGKY